MENKENICMEENKEASFVANSRVCACGIPQYEIVLPDQVATILKLLDGDTINFVEENGKIYLEKAEYDET